MAIIITSVGVADAYDKSFLDENGNIVAARVGHEVCADIECLISIISEQQEQLDAMNSTINELTLLHYPDTVEDMVFTVTTDKESYVGDEVMIVSGTLPDYGSSTITLMMISPDNMIVSIGSVISDGNGNYSKDILFNTALMNEDGTYKITVNYQGENISITFEYSVD